MRSRKKISGTAERPRIAVFASGKHIYSQFINDDSAKTLLSVSTVEEKFKTSGAKSTTVEGAKVLGKIAAECAVAIGISAVVFDRCGLQYHGKIKAFADAAREGGLKF
jgi:large subunit ribosomal protein L18